MIKYVNIFSNIMGELGSKVEGGPSSSSLCVCIITLCFVKGTRASIIILFLLCKMPHHNQYNAILGC